MKDVGHAKNLLQTVRSLHDEMTLIIDKKRLSESNSQVRKRKERNRFKKANLATNKIVQRRKPTLDTE